MDSDPDPGAPKTYGSGSEHCVVCVKHLEKVVRVFVVNLCFAQHSDHGGDSSGGMSLLV